MNGPPPIGGLDDSNGQLDIFRTHDRMSPPTPPTFNQQPSLRQEIDILDLLTRSSLMQLQKQVQDRIVHLHASACPFDSFGFPSLDAWALFDRDMLSKVNTSSDVFRRYLNDRRKKGDREQYIERHCPWNRCS
jgi:hypothetical protein